LVFAVAFCLKDGLDAYFLKVEKLLNEYLQPPSLHFEQKFKEFPQLLYISTSERYRKIGELFLKQLIAFGCLIFSKIEFIDLDLNQFDELLHFLVSIQAIIIQSQLLLIVVDKFDADE